MSIEMSSRTLNERLLLSLKLKAELIDTQLHLRPHLAVVLVGDNPSSLNYIKIKQQRAEEIGIDFTLHRLEASTSEDQVLAVIEELNGEERVNGIIVQLPLPESLNTDKILEAVAVEKDVDGLHPRSQFVSPVVNAISKLMTGYDLKSEDKKIVIVGLGRLVGKPLFEQMKKLHLAVNGIDNSVTNIAEYTREADILISATGQPNLIQPDMVKDGVIVIDADKDVSPEVAAKASYITPQVGGIGPLTVSCLLDNVIEATGRQHKLESTE